MISTERKAARSLHVEPLVDHYTGIVYDAHDSLRCILSKQVVPATAVNGPGTLAHKETEPPNGHPGPSPRTAGPLQFSDHLLPALRDAAVLGVETACDGEWKDDQLGRVRAAIHLLDALETGACTREQVAALTARAITMQGEIVRSAVELDEPAWPTTSEEADVLDARARLTRELIELRDAANGESG